MMMMMDRKRSLPFFRDTEESTISTGSLSPEEGDSFDLEEYPLFVDQQHSDGTTTEESLLGFTVHNNSHDEPKKNHFSLSDDDNNSYPSSSKSDAPSFSELLTFQSTSLLIWLTDPLLSLIDTTMVGWMATNSVTQLAAMGPATMLMDTLLYIMYFLAIGMNNQITSLLGQVMNHTKSNNNINNHAQHSPVKTSRLLLLFYRELQITASRYMGLAVASGGIIIVLVWSLGHTILSRFMKNGGDDDSDDDLIGLAIGYCRIRALSAPLAVLNMVAQSCCLVTHRTSTVRKAALAAVICNVLGDALLTREMGLVGSALATMAATVSASWILLPQVYRTMHEWKELEDQQLVMQQQAQTGCSSFDCHSIPFLALPDLPAFMEILRTTLPLAMTMWARMGAYCALTLRVTRLGASSAAAAHNILLRVYYLLGCLAESVGQTAQAYLPALLVHPPNTLVTREYKHTMSQLVFLAIGASLLGSTLALLLLPSMNSVFVQNTGVIWKDTQLAGISVAASLALHAVATLMEGVLIAKHKSSSLVQSYAITLCVHFLLLTKTNSLAGIWMSLVGWHISRGANFLLWNHWHSTDDKKQLVD